MLSRSRLFRLEPLGHEQTLDLLRRALADSERGYGDRHIDITDEALDHLAFVAGGDARTALNALELAVESTRPDAEGVVHLDLDIAQESIQRRIVRYDKGGFEYANVRVTDHSSSSTPTLRSRSASSPTAACPTWVSSA